MVTLTIDNRTVTVPEGTTILEAARTARIEIPTMCYLKEINEIGACRRPVHRGGGGAGAPDPLLQQRGGRGHGDPYHQSPCGRSARKTCGSSCPSMDHCVTCVRSGNCSLQPWPTTMNIQSVPFKEKRNEPPGPCPSHSADSSKCVKCLRCVSVCDRVQGMGVWGTGYRRPYHGAHPGRAADERGQLRPVRPVRGPLSRGGSAGAGRHGDRLLRPQRSHQRGGP